MQIKKLRVLKGDAPDVRMKFTVVHSEEELDQALGKRCVIILFHKSEKYYLLIKTTRPDYYARVVAELKNMIMPSRSAFPNIRNSQWHISIRNSVSLDNGEKLSRYKCFRMSNQLVDHIDSFGEVDN